jgi:hypothetical protein
MPHILRWLLWPDGGKIQRNPMKNTARKVNWRHLADAIGQDEVKLKLAWSADRRTREAIVRQARLMGFESPTAYLLQALAAVIAGNEEDTIITTDGRLLANCDARRYDRDGVPQNV